MHLTVFSAQSHDRRFLDAAHAYASPSLRISYIDTKLDRHTATLAEGADAVSLFVNDRADAPTLTVLAAHGVKLVTLRSAGYNHVDLVAARALGLTVTHVPDYSPHAVAEHTVALLLSLVRHIPRAYARVREGNFSIDGLLGFDLHGKSVALIGTGRIGLCTGRILRGFGLNVLAYDPHPSAEARHEDFHFASLEDVLSAADIISLHCPLVPATHHLINRSTLSWIKRGAILLNTSRGGLLHTGAVLEALETGRLGGLGLDVYEDEAPLYYEDHSGRGLRDEKLTRLVALPNVLVTGHQGFFTQEALAAIARSTFLALVAFAQGRLPNHCLVPPPGQSLAAPPLTPHGSAHGFPLVTADEPMIAA